MVEETDNSEAKDLRKLISIPDSILTDLKKLAIDSDKSLKGYIEYLLIEEVEKYRNRER